LRDSYPPLTVSEVICEVSQFPSAWRFESVDPRVDHAAGAGEAVDQRGEALRPALEDRLDATRIALDRVGQRGRVDRQLARDRIGRVARPPVAAPVLMPMSSIVAMPVGRPP
jgi:hypothetical protein